MQLLRCFGVVICKICLGDRSNRFDLGFYGYKIIGKILTYINKYCADSLEEFNFDPCTHKRSDLLKYFVRPFPKLTTFESQNLKFTKKFCLNKFFPKMRCLHIMDTFRLSFFKKNTKHFPYLEELHILDLNKDKKRLLCDKMIVNLLQLNPQLRHLQINSCGILSTDLIRSAVDSLQNIEIFTLRLLKSITFLNESDNIIRMKGVKSFKYDLFIHDSVFWSHFPFLFENLEKCRIHFPLELFPIGSFPDQFYNFIDRHSSIINLSIGGYIAPSKGFLILDWSRLAKSLPLLLEFELFKYEISADEAIEIMNKFQMLKKFRFELRGDYDSFRIHLDKNWDGKNIYGCVELIRKM